MLCYILIILPYDYAYHCTPFMWVYTIHIYTGSISSLDLVLTSLWGTACLSENFSLLRWEPNTGQHPAEAKSNARRASDSMLWRSGYSVLCSFAELPTTHCPRAVWRSGRAETASMLILSNKSSHKQVLHVWQHDMCILFFFPMTRGSAKGWHAQDSTGCSLLIQLSSIPSMQVLPYRSCMLTWRSRPECMTSKCTINPRDWKTPADPGSLKQIIETRIDKACSEFSKSSNESTKSSASCTLQRSVTSPFLHKLAQDGISNQELYTRNHGERIRHLPKSRSTTWASTPAENKLAWQFCSLRCSICMKCFQDAFSGRPGKLPFLE